MSSFKFAAFEASRLLFLLVLLASLGLLVSCASSAPEATPRATSAPVGAASSPTTAAPVASPTADTTATSAPTTVPPSATATVVSDENVALKATVSASGGADSAKKAVDGDPNTLWGAGGNAPQWYLLALDKPYLVDRIELVVAQTPAGQTSHQVLLADSSGTMRVAKTMSNTWTADGQTLTIPIAPAQVTNRVMIRTTDSPSYVAWREVRVFGRPPSAGARPNTITTAASQPATSWPKLSVSGDEPYPTQITNAGDGSGRLFVAERAGKIEIVKDGVPLAKPFLDISDRVKCCDSEQGLFSVAFPADYAKSGYFYVSYTTQPRGKYGPIGDLLIARYHVTSDPNVADPNSEEVVLVVPQPNPAHNGGHIAFGPKDGYLYIGTGDGGVEGDPDNSAQHLDTLLGKILRIDVKSGVDGYTIPSGNPFADKSGARPEIWAVGFRNPWQFSFDSKTGDLYIGDVGENKYEEIDFQPAGSHGGENYGWPTMEGDQCHRAANCDISGFTMPVVEYDHNQGCAVIGGQVYRGSDYPSLQGIYLYADLCTGRIWGLQQVNGAWENNLLYQNNFQITNIGSDDKGELYLTDFTHGSILSIDVPAPVALAGKVS